MRTRYSPLGLALRRLRDERVCTQRQLGEAIGRRPEWMSRLEGGKEYASLEEIQKIAAFFGLEGSRAFELDLAWRQSAVDAGAIH